MDARAPQHSFDDDRKWFIDPSTFKEGEARFFRLIGWGLDVQTAVGKSYKVVVKKYFFAHPCKMSVKDPAKPQYFAHVAELSADKGTLDTFGERLTEYWDNPDYRVRLQARFQNFGKPAESPAACARTEVWIMVQEVEPVLEEDKPTKKLYSNPIGTPLLMSAPAAIVGRLFGDKNPGLIDNPEVGTDLYSQEEGIDFSITRSVVVKGTQKQNNYATEPRRKNSDLALYEDSPNPYEEENQPPVMELIRKGIKVDEALELLDVIVGVSYCSEGGATANADVSDTAEAPRTKTPPVAEEKPATTGSPRRRPVV